MVNMFFSCTWLQLASNNKKYFPVGSIWTYYECSMDNGFLLFTIYKVSACNKYDLNHKLLKNIKVSLRNEKVGFL